MALRYPRHAILILMDSDDDCPAEIGPELRRRACEARPDVPIAVVLANTEYEAWFLAAAESLANTRGLMAHLTAPPDPEAIRDAKGWLSAHMTMRERKYSPTQDQASFSAVMDLDLARRRSRSFQKLWQEVARLMTEAKP